MWGILKPTDWILQKGKAGRKVQERGDMYIPMTDSHRYMAGTITIL